MNRLFSVLFCSWRSHDLRSVFGVDTCRRCGRTWRYGIPQ